MDHLDPHTGELLAVVEIAGPWALPALPVLRSAVAAVHMEYTRSKAAALIRPAVLGGRFQGGLPPEGLQLFCPLGWRGTWLPNSFEHTGNDPWKRFRGCLPSQNRLLRRRTLSGIVPAKAAAQKVAAFAAGRPESCLKEVIAQAVVFFVAFRTVLRWQRAYLLTNRSFWAENQ